MIPIRYQLLAFATCTVLVGAVVYNEYERGR